MSLQGLRVSMLISLVVGVGATTIAAIVGSFAAYFGGWIERASLWVIDLLLVLPGFLIIALFMRNINSNLALWLAFWLMALELDAVGTDHAQPDDVGARSRVRHGREVHGGARADDHRAAHPPERLVVADHRRHAGDRRRRLAETSLSFFGFGIRSPEVSLGTVISEGSRMATTFPWVFAGGAGFLVFMVAGRQLHRRRPP